MSFNAIMAYVGKITIAIMYFLVFTKLNKARKYDPTVTLRFDTRSWIEVIVVGVLNIAAILYPVNLEDASPSVMLVFVALVLTALHTRRIAAYGKKVIFILEHSFYIKDVSKVKYEKGLMRFTIKGRAFKLRFPLANMDLLLEKLSGRSKR